MKPASSLEKRSEGGYAVSGLLDVESVIRLRQQGFEIIENGSPKLEFDLSGVEIEGSPAIALLISWLKHAKNNGKQLCFRNPGKDLAFIAEASGVADLLGFDAA